MKKYGVFDPDGFPKSFYSDDVTPNIPKDATELTDAQWMELVTYQGLRKFIGGQVVVYNPPPPTLTRQEEANLHIAGGLTVNFPADTPGVGTYSVTSPDNLNINSVATNLAMNKQFPNNANDVAIFDTKKSQHKFDKRTYPVFAKAVSEFVHNAQLYAQNQADALPPNSVTLYGKAAPLPACSIYTNTVQSIVKNTPTKINFDIVEYDVTSAFNISTHRFQPLVAGFYMINCGCGVAAGAVQNYTSIYKNGVEYRRSTTSSEGGNTRLSTLVRLNGTTDYVEGFVRINSNFNTVPGGVLTSFSAVFVQPEA